MTAPEPLFVLGPPRSFTSVVCAMLGQHPEMLGLPEVHLFAVDTVGELFYYYKLVGRRRQDGLLRTLAQVYMGKQTVQTVELAQRRLGQRMEMETGALFREIVAKVAPRIVVEKSVSTVWRERALERMERAFPNARYIHLTRHPRSAGESMVEAVGNEKRLAREMMDYSTYPPTVDPQILWLTIHTNICNFLSFVPEDRKRRLKGEAMLTDVDCHLREIAQWMGLRTDDEALDEMKHPERSPFACLGPINAPFGNDPKFIKEPALRPARVKPQSLEGPVSWRGDGQGFAPEVKDLAKELGYE